MVDYRRLVSGDDQWSGAASAPAVFECSGLPEHDRLAAFLGRRACARNRLDSRPDGD
jgi:hypothetical protein